MTERVLDRDALGRVEGEQLLEQIQRELVRLGEHDLERDLLFEGQRPDVLARPAGLDAVVVLHRRRAEHIEDSLSKEELKSMSFVLFDIFLCSDGLTCYSAHLQGNHAVKDIMHHREGKKDSIDMSLVSYPSTIACLSGGP